VSKLPVLSGKKLCKVLSKIGYSNQTGGHIILRNENPPHRRLTIPNHRVIAKSTLRAIIRQASLTMEEFQKTIDKIKYMPYLLVTMGLAEV